MTLFSLLKTFNLQILQMAIKYIAGKYDLNINNSIVFSSVDSVTLLAIEINNKWNLKNVFLTLLN